MRASCLGKLRVCSRRDAEGVTDRIVTDGRHRERDTRRSAVDRGKCIGAPELEEESGGRFPIALGSYG